MLSGCMLIAAGVWLMTGTLNVGMVLAHSQMEYPFLLLADPRGTKQEDLTFAIVMFLWGPIGMISLLIAGCTKHGFIYRWLSYEEVVKIAKDKEPDRLFNITVDDMYPKAKWENAK